MQDGQIPLALVTFAGLSIGIADIVTLILFVVGVLEFTQLQSNLRVWLIPWLFLGVLIALSLLRGAATIGLGAATNDARGVLWVYFAMTWALATRPERLKLHTVSLVLGWMLVLVAIYHAVKYGIGGPTTVRLSADGSHRPNRILVAGQAATLLLCAGTVFLNTGDPRKGRTRYIGSAAVFLGVVLVSQARSVWLAGLIGMTAVLIFSKKGRVSGRARGRALALLAAGAWLAFVGWTFRSAGNGVFDAAVNSDTLDWRASGWQLLVSDAIARGPVTVAIGEPFGSGFLRKVASGASVGVQPHNWYVQIFLQLGIIGLMVFVGLLMAAVVQSRTTSPVWMFSLVAVGAYATAYAIDWFLAPWLAAAMVVALRGDGVADEASKATMPTGNSGRPHPELPPALPADPVPPFRS